MDYRPDSIMTSIVTLSMICYMALMVITAGYLQYNWDVRMDYLPLFWGVNPIASWQLSLSFGLALLLPALMIIQVLVMSERFTQRAKLFMVALVTLGSVLFLFQPVILTFLLLMPVVLLASALAFAGIPMTFVLKQVLAFIAIVAMGVLYRIMGDAER